MLQASLHINIIFVIIREGGALHARKLARRSSWTQLKSGLYGYKIKRLVSWTCQNSPNWDRISSESDVGETTTQGEISNLGYAGRLHLDNFTVGGRVAGCARVKRAADDSYEPRIVRKKTRL